MIIFENDLCWNTTIKTRMYDSVFPSVKFYKNFFFSDLYMIEIIYRTISNPFLHFLFLSPFFVIFHKDVINNPKCLQYRSSRNSKLLIQYKIFNEKMFKNYNNYSEVYLHNLLEIVPSYRCTHHTTNLSIPLI